MSAIPYEDRAIVPENPDMGVTLDFGEFKIAITDDLVEQFIRYLQEGLEEAYKNPTSAAFYTVMKGIIPFMPKIAKGLRKQPYGSMVPEWDRSHGGIDSLAYTYDWMMRAVMVVASQKEFKVEYDILSDDRTIAIRQITPTDPTGAKDEEWDGDISLEDSSNVVGYLGTSGDQGERKDNVREASVVQPESDVSGSEEVHP